MKFRHMGAVLFVASMASSLPASAGFLDIIKKELANEVKKTIGNTQDTAKQPSPPLSQQPDQPTGNISSTSVADEQLCESAATWLSAVSQEYQSSGSYQFSYTKAQVGQDVQFSPGSMTVLWLNDRYFEPAFGKKYDEFADTDAGRLYALLTKISQIKRVNNRNTLVDSECFTSIRNKAPSISDNVVKQAGLLFEQRRRQKYLPMLPEMRSASAKLAEYQARIDTFDPNTRSREQFNQIMLDALHWLELSPVDERSRFMARVKEIQGYYADAAQRNRFASVINGKSATTSDQSPEYSGPARFMLQPPQSMDYDSKVPLSDTSCRGCGLSAMGLIRTRTKEALAEVKGLEDAGYLTLKCQYGPFRGAEGGYSELTFWREKRPLLSQDMIQNATATRKASDIALTSCPSSWGEAVSYLYGKKAPPTGKEVSTQKELNRKGGQRFETQISKRQDFDNTDYALDGSGMIDDISTIVVPYVVGKRNAPNELIAEIDRLNASKQRLLQCRYSAGKNERQARIDIHFWADRKPSQISEGMGRWLEHWDIPLADAAASQCPEYLGEAVALAQATGTDTALTSAKEAAKRADADPLKPIKPRDDWYVGATANSTREDAQLAKELEREVSILEGGSGLTWQGFNSTVKTRIAPKLLSLARSGAAQVDKIPAGEAGRSAFEKWDELTAGNVMRAVLRLERIIASHTMERMAFSDVLKNEAQVAREKSDREGWRYNANIQFTRPIYYSFLPKYSERFANMPILDPKFMATVNKGMKQGGISRAGSSGLWRGGSGVTFTEKTTLVFGTPEEIAAWEYGNELGENAAKAVVYWGQFKGSIQQLDAQIREARDRFWTCYAKRCDDAAKLYKEYSTVLYWKDMHYLVQPTLLRKQAELAGDKNQTMQMLYKMGGADEVDDGMPTSCSSERAAFEGQVGQVFADWRGGSLGSYKDKLENAFKGQAYSNWQQCRDKMEYIMRPRKN